MSTKKILRSIVGRRFGLGHGSDPHLISNGRIMAPNPFDPAARVVLFDDFFGDNVMSPWDSEVGTDAQVVAPTIQAAANGVVRLTAGDDAAATMAVNGVQLHSALNWQADNGDLVFETRLKMSAITNISVYAGFTDQVSALEMPILSAASANTITTNATDAVGFFFDTSMTDDYWWGAGVKNNTDATHANNSTAPTADTYQKLRIEVDTDGDAVFYIDGKFYTSVSSAVTATVSLTPVVAMFSRTTTAHTVDVDYIYCAQDR